MNLLLSEGVEQGRIFSDAFTGTKMDRPEFKKLCGILQPGDSLIVAKLDRFARSLVEGTTIIEELIKRGVRIHILNMGVLDNTPTSVLTRNIFLAFAAFERDLIIERTQAGKEIARLQPGYREGRPKSISQHRINHALSMLATHSMPEVSKLMKISESTLYRELRRRRDRND